MLWILYHSKLKPPKFNRNLIRGQFYEETYQLIKKIVKFTAIKKFTFAMEKLQKQDRLEDCY